MVKTIFERIELAVETKKNCMPNSKVILGRLAVDRRGEHARFEETEQDIITIGVRHSRRVMHGKRCAVWWNPVKEKYRVCITIDPQESDALQKANFDFDDCYSFLAKRFNA